MSFKSITSAITRKAGRQILQAQKHSPKIMFVAGVVGVVGAAVLASRATLKLDSILIDAEDEMNEIHTLENNYEPTVQEKARVIAKAGFRLAKLYGPAVGVGAASIGLLTGAHVVLSRRNAALSAAFFAVSKGFADYRSRVVAELGEDKDREFLYCMEDHEIVEHTAKGDKVSLAKRATTGSIYSVLFDEANKNWSPNPGYNQLFLRSQQNYANDLLRARGHLFLNEVYDMLGFNRTPAGQIVGWVYGSKTGDNYVDFGIFEISEFDGIRFVMGTEKNVWLDFNVDGEVYKLI